MAAKPRLLAWPSGVTPVAIGDRRVGAGLKQKPHDLGMHRPAVAEDHSLQQRGPAEPIDVVDVDPGREQNLHGIRHARNGRPGSAPYRRSG